MMHCQICGVYFDRPRVVVTPDPTVGPSFRYREELCPVCGMPHIEPASTCPKCGENMPQGSILCAQCRRELLDRFRAFADGLTADEEEQMDDWLDGRSITERGTFT